MVAPVRSMPDSSLHTVMYIVDPVDEYARQQLARFGGMVLKSTSKEGPDIEDIGVGKNLEKPRAHSCCSPCSCVRCSATRTRR